MSLHQEINTLTITDHLTGWTDAFPIPDKKAKTTVHIFISNYLPIHMCPHFILSRQWNRIQEPADGQCSPTT